MRFAKVSLGALFLCIALCGQQAIASAVHLRGSTTLMPIAQIIAENYMHEHPDVKIVISGGSTERGYKAILDGTADIAMASSDPREDILNECQLKQIQLHKILLGYTNIFTAVNASNNISNLSLKQIKDIFAGRITNWKNVGGADLPIQVYVGPPSGGINDSWKKLILGEEDTFTPQGIVKNNSERIRITAKDAKAITFLTLDNNDRRGLKILRVDNIAPDINNPNNTAYALHAPLMLVTAHQPTAVAQAFIQYFSSHIEQARAQLRQHQELQNE